MRENILRIVSCVFVFALGGCLSTVVPENPGNTPPTDAQLKQMLVDNSFYGPDFVRVDQNAYTTDLSAPGFIEVYVSAFAWNAYKQIEPDQTQAAVIFPVGGTIVRVVDDENHTPSKITLMVQEPEGYFPSGGNFLYGVTDMTGNVLPDASGAAQWGPISACTSCHLMRKDTAWLFGVPPNDRTHSF